VRAIALNTALLGEAATGLPCADPVRQGAAELLAALLAA
jgi:hypothetical protein